MLSSADMDWLADIVAAADLPDPPATHTPAFIEPVPGDLYGLPTRPHVAACDQCGDECDALCPLCGAGLHTIEHTERHGLGECQGEDHWPEWATDPYSFF
jgi:hypothetical protein